MWKFTVSAPANIAFVKYWGSRDVDRGVPLNPSISMTLGRCRSICTAVFHPAGSLRPASLERGAASLEPAPAQLDPAPPPLEPAPAEPSPVQEAGEEGPDEVLLLAANGSLAPAPRSFAAPVLAQLARIRRWAGVEGRFQIATRNTFPSASGLASSAAGFAALSLAAARAAGREPSAVELSDLARRSGSGSAARSAFGGYVEWPASDALEPVMPAKPLASHEHWELRNVIAVVETAPKQVSSREGHRRVLSSPYFEARLGLLPSRLDEVRAAIRDRDFGRLVPVLEAEAVDLHFLAMSARPPIRYWTPGTVEVLDAVRSLRRGGVHAAWTMDAGPNVHVICLPESEPTVAAGLEALASVRALIRDRVGAGPRSEGEPLF